MAQEVVSGQDVVDFQALAAREALAYVTLEEGVVLHEVLSLAIAEHGFIAGSAAGLTVERRRHTYLPVDRKDASSLPQPAPGKSRW
jgi:hypothetical protein